MPELPEVETVVRLVRPDLVGRTVTGAAIDWERTLGGVPAAAFRRRVRGRRIDGIRRRGKHFVIGLGGTTSIVGHLRMSGRLVVRSTDGTVLFKQPDHDVNMSEVREAIQRLLADRAG